MNHDSPKFPLETRKMIKQKNKKFYMFDESERKNAKIEKTRRDDEQESTIRRIKIIL